LRRGLFLCGLVLERLLRKHVMLHHNAMGLLSAFRILMVLGAVLFTAQAGALAHDAEHDHAPHEHHGVSCELVLLLGEPQDRPSSLAGVPTAPSTTLLRPAQRKFACVPIERHRRLPRAPPYTDQQ